MTFCAVLILAGQSIKSMLACLQLIFNSCDFGLRFLMICLELLVVGISAILRGLEFVYGLLAASGLG